MTGIHLLCKQEAILCALGAFPTQLNGDRDKERITLCLRPVVGISSWAGLRVAKNSANMWRHLLSNGSDVVEVGVFMGRIRDGDDCELELRGKNGIPIKAQFNLGVGLGWGDNLGPVNLPKNYDACLDFIAYFVYSTAYPNLEHGELKLRVQLEILSSLVHGQYRGFKASQCTEMVQKYSYPYGSGEIVNFRVHYA